ncbi:MAG: hypothetical protein LLF94_03625 [Chlamydiales bacterium]|nr:hypothetical protein [Chlamydiales bacterium]
MNVKKYISYGVAILAVFSFMLQGHSNDDTNHSSSSSSSSSGPDLVTKYVQGDACSGGTGTKNHPYNTLVAAQNDESWDVLVVLPSRTPLDGGITLRSGTSLIGACDDPTETAVAPNQPTITNTSNYSNGGNGVVVNGDAHIERIYFKNTYASAINFDLGENLSVKEVLVTGHNSGQQNSSNNTLAITDNTEVAGIQGKTTLNGTTDLYKVIIRNNFTGSGVNNIARDGAQRHLIVDTCEFAELTSQNPGSDPQLSKSLDGIAAIAEDEGTHLDVQIKNCYFHDFKAQALNEANTHAVQCASLNGAKIKSRISCSTFYNIANSHQIANWHILSQALSDPAVVGDDVKSHITLAVHSCAFEEPVENAQVQVASVHNITSNSCSEWQVKNCTVKNVFDAFISEVTSSGRENGSIVSNTVSGFEAFYIATTDEAQTPISNPERFTEVLIKKNVYTGGDRLGAINIIANADGSTNPWNRLRIYVKDNCFNGQGSGNAGLQGLSNSGTGAGDAAIRAHENSIVGYNYDIFDNGANVNYLAEHNWWGQGASCTSNSGCSSTQSCHDGFCVGPDNVVNNGNGVVDVSHSRRSPIQCPDSCPNSL